MKKIYGFLLSTLLIVSCSHSSKVSTPAKETKEKSAAPTQQAAQQTENIEDQSILAAGTEIALGESIAGVVSQKYKLYAVSKEFQDYVNGIAAKLAENSNRPTVHYEITILDTKDFVAMGSAGGRIIISKGFLDAIQTESELACLIGNQMAHVAKQHLITILIYNVIYAKQLDEGTITDRLSKQAQFEIFQLGYDYDYINEADRLGATYAMHVGYDIHGLQTLFQRVQPQMEKKHSYGMGEWDADRMAHRVSMNQVLSKGLEKIDKSQFPKADDRYKVMIKKLDAPKKNRR